MIEILVAFATAATPPDTAKLQRVLEMFVTVGICERHIPNEVMAQFDPYGVDASKRLQERLVEARSWGKKEGQRLRVTKAQCVRFLDEVDPNPDDALSKVSLIIDSAL